MQGELSRRVPWGVAALFAIIVGVAGFWIGHHVGSSRQTQVISGTVSTVGGQPGQPPTEFAVTLDGTDTTEGYGIGQVPWTKGDDSTINMGSTPSCIATGEHVIFGVIAVTFQGSTSSQVTWAECR
ncbi:hypothetical protein [Actinospica robiniae]|uniref:hypothetical protein n=1 Tax=Actinospica robiniae TaxID=304901 RepID=UPI00054E1905|nr:hypothetical protein [Actinospica robiniae]